MNIRRKKVITIIVLKKGYIEEFYKWFVGFSDAEASFGIFPLFDKKKKKLRRFF